MTGFSVIPKNLYVLHSLPYVCAKWAVPFFRLKEVPAPNLDSEIAYPD